MPSATPAGRPRDGYGAGYMPSSTGPYGPNTGVGGGRNPMDAGNSAGSGASGVPNVPMPNPMDPIPATPVNSPMSLEYISSPTAWAQQQSGNVMAAYGSAAETGIGQAIAGGAFGSGRAALAGAMGARINAVNAGLEAQAGIQERDISRQNQTAMTAAGLDTQRFGIETNAAVQREGFQYDAALQRQRLEQEARMADSQFAQQRFLQAYQAAIQERMQRGQIDAASAQQMQDFIQNVLATQPWRAADILAMFEEAMAGDQVTPPLPEQGRGTSM